MKIALSTLWASLVRTLTPIVVGWALSLFVTLNITLDPEFEIALNGVITIAFQGIYYVLVRLLELHVAPWFGKLLGSAKQPMIYAKPDSSGTPVITDVTKTGAVTTVELTDKR